MSRDLSENAVVSLTELETLLAEVQNLLGDWHPEEPLFEEVCDYLATLRAHMQSMRETGTRFGVAAL